MATLQELFPELQQNQQQNDLNSLFPELNPTSAEQALGTAEVAGTILSSAAAEPIAGIVGSLESAARGLANFVGFDAGDPVAEGVDTIESIRDFLTFTPGTPEGKRQAQQLGEFISPVADGFKSTESFLGNSVLDATGSPALAAVAHSLPTAALEALGLKGLRSAKSPLRGEKLSNNVAKAIQQAAPDIEQIKTLKTQTYNQLDNLGISLKPDIYNQIADKATEVARKAGLDPQVTPKAQGVINRLLSEKDAPKKLSELDTLRRVAQNAANDIDKTEAAIGSKVISVIDDSIDMLSEQIGGEFKQARGLAQRGFKSQSINDMIENASHTASGMENGLRIEARKILKNKKKRRGFSKDELDALRKIEQGTTAANMAKFLGKFGISEGQATSMLGASIGVGGGGALGAAFGGPGGAAIGALTIPAVGQIAKKTAQRITLNNARFADDLVRAGRNSKAIVRAYLKNTPVKDRNVGDLTDLLLQEDVNPADIKSFPKGATATNKLVKDAVFFAEEIKRRAQQAASIGAITTPNVQEQQ